jgi:cobalt-zinc-cadmium resistance protein CzcA
VVIGGVIGAMIMSLLVLRVLYLVFNAPLELIKSDTKHETADNEPREVPATAGT